MRYFTIGEMLFSAVAVNQKIPNTGTTLEIENNLRALIEKVLDPAREKLGKPIFVNSGFRCPRLNTEIHGSPNSQHLKGEAADLRCSTKATQKELFYILSEMDFDQLIWEKNNKSGFEWIHVSYKRDGSNRHQKFGLEVK